MGWDGQLRLPQNNVKIKMVIIIVLKTQLGGSPKVRSAWLGRVGLSHGSGGDPN
jgi:hypothetical protein